MLATEKEKLLSIVTIVKNDLEGLVSTVNSIKMLVAHNSAIEHIIVDGGSTDGTGEFASTCSAIAISESDGGIADAFNKGVRLANGKWIHFLNARDLATADFENILNCLRRECTTSIVVAGVQWPGSRNALGIDHAKNNRLWLRMTVPHQGQFVPREAFEKVGEFDPAWKLGMDYDWLLRAIRGGYHIRTVPDLVVVSMDGAGVSQRNVFSAVREVYAIQKKNRWGLPVLREAIFSYYVFDAFRRNLAKELKK